MTCYKPLKAYRILGDLTKAKIVFQSPKGHYTKLDLACGQCIGCRLRRSREWAARCVHEASLHGENIFLTLTYDDKHLPSNGSLDITHVQLFLKRLRRSLNTKIRFLGCGEYGDDLGRPHYHLIIFNYRPSDEKIYKRTKSGVLFTSEILEKHWGKGFCPYGAVTPESAAYVARYSLKKINGDMAESHYQRIDPNTGEIYHLKPEYIHMSRRPGIGMDWIKKYHEETYITDTVIINKHEVQPPKAYDRFMEIFNPDVLEGVKEQRQYLIRQYYNDLPPEERTEKRLDAKHKHKLIVTQQLTRNLDKETTNDT